MQTINKIKAPLMYKGWIIYKRKDTKMFYAYNFKTDKYLSPLYRTWPLLKKINNLINK